jgi:cell fate regulator YaaT (PSP1 superfamily)
MEETHLEASAREEGKCCERFIKEMDLPMKVVDSEHIFGGERIVIYFSSNGRVDFRELVRRMAREYQTRIELRQIGSRDEAKLISDYESCGQECCCRRFLKILEPVNMRMAKLQKATLDPSKISGHCGRLKCCLRYEDDTYRDLKERLPKKNALVKTPRGEGKVVGMQILTQLVVVQDERGDREAFPVEEIQIISRDQTGDSAYRDDDDAVRKEPAKLQDDYSKAQESDPVDEASPLVSQEDNKDSAVGPQENQKNNRNRNRRRRNQNRNRNTDGNAGPQGKTDSNPTADSTNRQPDQGRTNDTL